jgi:dethiobiotin synthetase
MAARMSPRVLFVAGAHTEIGKTHVACGLIRAARDEGLAVAALKPVVSGFDEDDWADSDPGRLLSALELPLSGQALDAMSPWRFVAPLAPPMAADLEHRSVTLQPVAEFCRRQIAASRADRVMVEGVGGLMSPIVEGATSLDLLEALACWSVLVGGGYLGAVSHTLTALEVMRARGVPPGAVLVSESDDPAAPDFMATVALVAQHAGATPVIPVSRGPGYGWAGLALKAVFG